MTTSSSTNFSTSRDELIKGALRIAGAVGQGETPTTYQITEGAEALNMLVKAWQTDGMSLWVTKEYTLPLVAGTSTYTPTTKMMKVLSAYCHNSSSNVDIPMTIITRDQYNRLGNKTTTGTPIQLYHSPNRTDSTIKVFPTPDSVSASINTLVLVYQKPYDDFDNATDEPEFPSEWFEALKFNLAHRLSSEYGMSLNDRKQLLSEAVLLKTEAMNNGGEEGSYFFGADIRYE